MASVRATVIRPADKSVRLEIRVETGVDEIDTRITRNPVVPPFAVALAIAVDVAIGRLDQFEGAYVLRIGGTSHRFACCLEAMVVRHGEGHALCPRTVAI